MTRHHQSQGSGARHRAGGGCSDAPPGLRLLGRPPTPGGGRLRGRRLRGSGRRNDAVVVLERLLGPLRRGERAWHIAHEVPVGDGIGELGRCMSGSFCLRSRQGLMLVLSEQGIQTCLAEWTGIPYGWDYRPSGDPSPRRLPPGRA